jgi:hypothetical protein
MILRGAWPIYSDRWINYCLQKSINRDEPLKMFSTKNEDHFLEVYPLKDSHLEIDAQVHLASLHP